MLWLFFFLGVVVLILLAFAYIKGDEKKYMPSDMGAQQEQAAAQKAGSRQVGNRPAR